MRTSTLILSLTTATFAMSTAYLAWELHERDAESVSLPAGAAPGAALAGSSASGKAGIPATSATAGLVATPSGSPTPLPAAGGEPAPQAAAGGTKPVDANDPSMAFARQLVARLDDSVQRQVLLDEQKTSVRRQYARLQQRLKLSDAQFEQLVTTLAEQNLQGQENWARCAIDAACDPKDASRMRVDERTQELLALLGADSYEDFTAYRETLQERDAVTQLRGRLADDVLLPQSAAEQLIAALADERKRYAQEATARGASLNGWGTNLGMIMYPEDAVTIEARLAEAAQYSQRMRARAATVLTAAQLAAFIQMQDELLAQMAAYLRPTPAPRKASSLKLAQG
jgi:hypothetical protein